MLIRTHLDNTLSMVTPREILHQYSIRPSRKFSQSFLVDLNTIFKIASACRVSSGDTVVEIGAGIGFLTKEIARKAKRLIAIELDPRMVEILREQLAGMHNAQVHEGDVLKFDFKTISDQYNTKLKVIGNVPYNISSPVLFHLLAHRSSISDFTLMLQKEVVERLVSGPGRKSYGVPSVLLQMYANVERLFDVSANCFYPRPQVESSMIRGVFLDWPRAEIGDDILFNRLVKAAFAQRRKMLINNLKNASFLAELSDACRQDALDQACIDGHRRGETLTVAEFAHLSNVLKYHLTNPR